MNNRQDNFGNFGSKNTTRFPQVPTNRIIDYTMYRLVEEIDGIIIYLTFVRMHE